MTQAPTILIVDDDPDIRTAGKLLLKRDYPGVTTLEDPADLPGLFERASPDIVLLDMNFSPGESDAATGLAWLERIQAMDPDCCVIVITAHGGIKTAVEAMKRGASDFVTKPWQNERLLATVAAAVKLRASRRRATELEATSRELTRAPAASPGMLGDSAAIAQVQKLIARASPTDASILVLGENGTGKELVARAVHEQSARRDMPFVSVDLGALPENLFESELFGHKKGAFTGADSDRSGRFVAAHGGTLFLDEIGNLPLHLQAKLLTVLEQRRVTPVGMDKDRAIDVRIVAATNLTAAQLADEQRFRQDLLFRLKTVEITLPPLRERGGDAVILARHFIARFEQKYHRPARAMGADLEAALVDYHWPGNVRELRHAAERAVILSGQGEYQPADFALGPGQGAAPTAADASVAPPPADTGAGDDLNLERLECRAVEKALRRHRYNISKAAADLGLTRAALYRRMEKHGL